MTTLRKSFRRVLALSPGLRVRMRTLVLPQLLPAVAPGAGAQEAEDDDNEGEKKIVLAVEVENPATEGMSFEVEAVKVDIGGKGGEATVELVCLPDQQQRGAGGTEQVFPLRLASVEQYNLLYAVSIASPPRQSQDGDDTIMRGRGDDMRPVAIVVAGRPFVSALALGTPASAAESGIEYPTATFDSRWNCQLDLAGFYASLSTATHAAPPPHPHGVINRLSKTTFAPAPAPAPNAVAGDKRYSLASLASQSSFGAGGNPRDSRQQRAMMPSQAMTHNRVPSMRPSQHTMSSAEGLLVSVKLLPPANTGEGSNPTTTTTTTATTTTVRPFEPFSVEVFVHNRTTEVRRFRLSVPPRPYDAEAQAQAQVREIVDKRRSQHPGTMHQDDPCTSDIILSRRCWQFVEADFLSMQLFDALWLSTSLRRPLSSHSKRTYGAGHSYPVHRSLRDYASCPSARECTGSTSCS